MELSNEQLIYGLKMALATFEVQLRNDGLNTTGFHAVVNCHQRLQELLIDAGELDRDTGPDLNPLLLWARDQLIREQGEL